MRSCKHWVTSSRPGVFFLLILVSCGAWAQSAERLPQVGYIYPAGGQRGTLVQATIGGQHLRGADLAHIVGDGVRVSVVGYVASYRRQPSRLEVRQLAQRLAELLEQPRQTDVTTNRSSSRDSRRVLSSAQIGNATSGDLQDANHPLLRDIERMNGRELEHLASKLRKSRTRQQRNEQIAETVLVDLIIDSSASPGEREIRIATPNGLSNPLRFQIGELPEVAEQEPNDQSAPEGTTVQLPVTFNGQILPGDADRFRFRARQGEILVMEAYARRLIPYLADAVPGWFQATLTLYDSAGSKVAFADDYRFDPDPVVFYKVPKDDEYELQIQDSIHRGREDFVYRISVDARPFVTSIYPLGGTVGDPASVQLTGVNLPLTRATLDTSPGAESSREVRWNWDGRLSNSVTYAVDTLPECEEHEPNDTQKQSRFISLPTIINGCISKPADVDIFRFVGCKGDQVVADVNARRLLSPLDSVVRLMDKSGAVLASNDDREDSRTGLQTHQADAYLCVTLPEDGTYYLEIACAQKQGGKEYGYRLRVSAPEPDFRAMVTPSSLSVPVGGSVPITVHVLRRDGFDGEVTVGMRGFGEGFVLSGGRIPGDKTSVRMTLTAPDEVPARLIVLEMEAHAEIGGRALKRRIVPADDMMQAFAYQHLVAAQHLVAHVRDPRRRTIPISLNSSEPILIREGRTTQVRVNIPRRPIPAEIQFELGDVSECVKLDDVHFSPGSMTLVLRADGAAAKPGSSDNLIVEVFALWSGVRDGTAQEPRRVSLGVLPAIPFEIVQR